MMKRKRKKKRKRKEKKKRKRKNQREIMANTSHCKEQDWKYAI
jgi:hypothetical protein